MGLADMGHGTGTATDTKKGICTRTRDTRIRVPGGFPVPVSITTPTEISPTHHLTCPLIRLLARSLLTLRYLRKL
jgi:hypothetical protein